MGDRPAVTGNKETPWYAGNETFKRSTTPNAPQTRVKNTLQLTTPLKLDTFAIPRVGVCLSISLTHRFHEFVFEAVNS
jgi:hypothetical protein